MSTTRYRLDNLGPQPESRKKGKIKGRRNSTGQGNSCGFGMRGQKSRSGPGVRKGFEGGQMPFYRRMPKLRGIAGGMHAGLPKYIPVNLKDIETAGFQEGDKISLETLKQKGLINPSGRERKLPLKILGNGELSVKLNIKARAFSASAKEKLEAAGCSLTELPDERSGLNPQLQRTLPERKNTLQRRRQQPVTEREFRGPSPQHGGSRLRPRHPHRGGTRSEHRSGHSRGKLCERKCRCKDRGTRSPSRHASAGTSSSGRSTGGRGSGLEHAADAQGQQRDRGRHWSGTTGLRCRHHARGPDGGSTAQTVVWTGQ